MDIYRVYKLGVLRREKKTECIYWNDWIDEQIKLAHEPDREIWEELRNELNRNFWDEDYRLVGMLLAETFGRRGVDIVRGLFGVQSHWRIDDLQACMPRYSWGSIETFCYHIRKFKYGDGFGR